MALSRLALLGLATVSVAIARMLAVAPETSAPLDEVTLTSDQVELQPEANSILNRSVAGLSGRMQSYSAYGDGCIRINRFKSYGVPSQELRTGARLSECQHEGIVEELFRGRHCEYMTSRVEAERRMDPRPKRSSAGAGSTEAEG